MIIIEHIAKPNNPITWSESLVAWTVCSYKDVVSILKNPNFSAAAANIKHQAEQLPSIKQDIAAAHHHVINSIQKQLNWSCEQMTKTATDICKKLDGQASFDLQKDLTLPFCEQLAMLLTGTSVEEKKAQVLLESAQAIFLMNGKKNQLEAEKATIELAKHFLPLIEQRRLTPKSDFVSVFAQGEDPGYVLLSPVIQMFVGLATSLPLLLGNVLLSLLSYPEQMRRYMEQPQQAVSELMRYCGPAQLVYRLTLKDTIINEHLFKRGDRLALLLTHANQDSAVFNNPKKLDFNRNAVAHLSFGKGIHTCLGAPIIRNIVEIFPHIILSTFPNLTPDIANIHWGGSNTIRGAKALPVHFSKTK
jgi:cytochrome P450